MRVLQIILSETKEHSEVQKKHFKIKNMYKIKFEKNFRTMRNVKSFKKNDNEKRRIQNF